MYARPVQQLPEGKDWLYEVKFDGYRCLAGKDSTGVTLWSRRANRFTDHFPTIATACEDLPPDTLLDGEIIALDQNGRISFNMLQHHRSQAQAILFYAFDVGPEVIFPQRSADEDSCLRSMASLQHATSSSQKRLPVDLPLALY